MRVQFIKRHRVVVLMAILALAVSAATAGAHWHGGSYEHHSGDTNCSGPVADPIGVVFHGTAASYRYLGGDKGDIHYHTGWDTHPETGHARYISYGQCNQESGQVAQSLGYAHSRYHIRLWQQPQDHAPGKHVTVGTPHHEYWIWGGDCAPGNHAVDPGAVDRGRGYQLEYGASGFDRARSKLARAFNTRHHTIEHVKWGNTQSRKSCDGYWAGSNGTVDLISVGRP